MLKHFQRAAVLLVKGAVRPDGRWFTCKRVFFEGLVSPPAIRQFASSSFRDCFCVLRRLCCSLESSIARFSVDLTHAAIDNPIFSAAAAYCFKSCSLTRILSQLSFFSSSPLLQVNIVPRDQEMYFLSDA
jgi:hypothetical protein